MAKKPDTTTRSASSTRAGTMPPFQNGGERKQDQVFDHWLEEKLRSAYSSVLDEPIPDDLIRLIHQKLKD